MQLSNKEKKRLYDIEYRRLNRESLKKKKAVYFQKTYNPVEESVKRKLKMAEHVEYCRNPEYKKYKQQYDKISRHGEWRECYELIEKIFTIVKQHYDTPYERRKARGYYEARLPH